MVRILGLAVLALLLVACGGGGGDTAKTLPVDPPVVASTKDFPIRTAFESITAPPYVVANLTGYDNNSGQPISEPYVVNGVTYYRDIDINWTGNISVARRTVAVDTPLGTSAYAVDYNISLRRNRDGKEYLDAITIFFDGTARPLALVSLNSYLALWLTQVDGLPLVGKVGVSGGAAVANVCKKPLTASLTVLSCDGIDYGTQAVSSWVLKADTANTGLITFTYASSLSNALSFSAIAEVGIRIDEYGSYQGVVYKLIDGDLVVKMTGR